MQQSHTFAGRAFLAVEKDTAKSYTAFGKPEKECACPARKEIFKNAPPATKKEKGQSAIMKHLGRRLLKHNKGYRQWRLTR